MPTGLGLPSYEHFLLYETRARFYLVAYTSDKRAWRVLKISRTEATEVDVSEDPAELTERQAAALLRTIADGNAPVGGLQLAARACGVVGVIRFLEGYYLILVTQRRRVGTLAGHAVYAIDDTEVVPLPHASVRLALSTEEQAAEKRYVRLLANVDLRRDFFFSYTYPLTSSLQEVAAGHAGCPWSSPFCWNAHLAQPLAACLGGLSSPAMRRWLLPLIHGSFGATSLALCGTPVSVVLLARRSRRFAGTRYRKRGVNDAGDVANYVETEQVRGSIPLFWSQEASALSPKPDILLARHDPYYGATKKHFAQLQARYGTCVALSLVKASEKRPRETLLRRELAAAVDAINAAADAAAAASAEAQTQPAAPPDTLPPPHVVLCNWDFSRRAKRSHPAEVLRSLSTLCTGALAMTGVYVAPRPVDMGAPPRSRASAAAARAAAAALGWMTPSGETPGSVAGRAFRTAGAESVLGLEMDKEEDADAAPGGLLQCTGEGDPFGEGCLQVGVLRTNCIDCLDRSNVAQFAYGVVALGVQLMALDLSDEATLAADSPLVESLSQLYQHMGDALAWQYGGSDAHSHMLQAAAAPAAAPSAFTAAMGPPGPAMAGLPGAVGGVGAWRTAGNYSRQWLTSAQRFYSATMTDAEKQDAINLFLGHFVPQRGRPAIWELDNDVWLHARAQQDPPHHHSLAEGAADAAAGRAPGEADPLAWSALHDGRRSPFGRAALSDATGSLASFDAWADPPGGWAPVPPAVRVYPPGLRSGFTAPVRPCGDDGPASALQRKASGVPDAVRAAQRAAVTRARAFYADAVARGQVHGGKGLGTRDEQRAAAQRYARFCTDAALWGAVFSGAAAARAAAQRSLHDEVLDPASLAALEHADRAALDLVRASVQAVRAAPEVAAAEALYSGVDAGEDTTLAAAQAFLSAPDDLAPLPEWTMPAGAHAHNHTAAPPAEPSAPAPRRPSETAAHVATPAAAPHQHPPPPGSDLRRWLAAREADARSDMMQAVQPGVKLGGLGLGVLLPAPAAANGHTIARAQLERLVAAPVFVDFRTRVPQQQAAHTPKMRRFSAAAAAAAFAQTWRQTGAHAPSGDGEHATEGWAFHAFTPPPPSRAFNELEATLLSPQPPPAVQQRVVAASGFEPDRMAPAQPLSNANPFTLQRNRRVVQGEDDFFSGGGGPPLGSLQGMDA